MQNGIPRILIIRLSAIGDVVRVLPALHCLREVYPEAQIDWVVESKSAEVLSDHPALDQVLVFERTSNWKESARNFWNLCKIIRKNKYDVVIDFHGILKSGLITGMSGAPKRYGFARPRSQEGSYLFTNHKVKLGSEVVNRIHENLALCSEFHPGYKSLDVTIAIPDDAIEAVEDFFEESFHGAKLIVAMHVPVDRPEKQWPLENFAELSDMLLADGRFDVLLTWGPGQYDCIQEVLKLAKREPIVAPGTDSLKQYMAMIQQSDIYFGGDTGPMHIASALDVPLVAVFGGTDPAQHATLRIPYTVLFAKSDTRAKAKRPSESSGMTGLTSEAAYDAIVEIASFTSL
ncbi:MAG: hypothetical protein COA73_12595 [Candidatus Hydrogenedentota bacterium]|nr:MAG: hypothetical protein COA73_12595 [Candidatus Hydrogenedentota bacterium]